MATEKKYWDEEMETMPLDKLRQLQEERLRVVVTRAYEKSAFYRRKFDDARVKPADIKTLADITKLPLILDAEYRAAPIPERLAIPLSEARVVCSSAGTTGMPDILPRDERDWEECRYRATRFVWQRGIRPGDVVQVLSGFECTRRAYEDVGATTLLIHAGRGILDNQIRLAEAMNVTVIEYLPSLVVQYFDRARELGIELKGIKISGMGEGFAPAYRRKMENKYHITFLPGMWGATELRVSAGECEERNGMHIYADRCIIEVIDPETGQPLGPGEEGELVATSLTMDSVPIVRWRSGDVGRLLPYELCPCGRTHPKISSLVRGRLAHMIRVKGKKIFPMDMEEVVATVPGLGDQYQIVVDKPGEQNRLKVKVEYDPGAEDMAILKKEAEQTLGQALGVDSEVELIPQGSIGRTLFKAQRIVTA